MFVGLALASTLSAQTPPTKCECWIKTLQAVRGGDSVPASCAAVLKSLDAVTFAQEVKAGKSASATGCAPGEVEKALVPKDNKREEDAARNAVIASSLKDIRQELDNLKAQNGEDLARLRTTNLLVAGLIVCVAALGILLYLGRQRTANAAIDWSPVRAEIAGVTYRQAAIENASRSAVAGAAEANAKVARLEQQIEATQPRRGSSDPGRKTPPAVPIEQRVASAAGGATLEPKYEPAPEVIGDPVVAAYNTALRSGRQNEFFQFESAYAGECFTLENARERAQNRDLSPIFRTSETGPYYAVTDNKGGYSVYPRLGRFPWGLRRDAAMDFVFRFPDLPQEPELGVAVPAKFRRNGDEWTMVTPGELEAL